jgi:hypothetical protein
MKIGPSRLRLTPGLSLRELRPLGRVSSLQGLLLDKATRQSNLFPVVRQRNVNHSLRLLKP